MSLLFLLIFSFSSHALELKGQEGKSFTFIEINKLRVSSSCQKECLALKDYSSKAQSFKWKMGNPASEFCLHVGGTDQILSYPNLDQDSVCLFSDGSYIISWDLYRKNQKAAK